VDRVLKGPIFFKFSKGIVMKVVVKEIPNPAEGQQALDQNGNLAVFFRGQWISQEEFDRGVYIRLLDTGDCV